jgi:hypothetical protein
VRKREGRKGGGGQYREEKENKKPQIWEPVRSSNVQEVGVADYSGEKVQE